MPTARAPGAPPAIAKRALPIAAGTVIAGKYRLERPLSRGAMGAVWCATHLALETHVAIKFMASLTVSGASASGRAASPGEPNEPASASSSRVTEMRSRFEREAKAAAQIRSANVVQILDYGVDRDTPYIVMELLEGEDLGQRLKRVKRLSLADASRIIVAVARALQRAHDSGLVHRDLKPGNIFLAREGDEEVPKVLDFGVAKTVHDRTVGEGTLEGTLVGTPSYMSPEQAMGRSSVDHRADLWSLGVIAYRALTGLRPFQSQSLLELVVQICSDSVVPPTQRVPGLPAAIDAFFERALQRDAALRFQSAKDMARAFAALAPRGSSVPPPSTGAPFSVVGPQLAVPTPSSDVDAILAAALAEESAADQLTLAPEVGSRSDPQPGASGAIAPAPGPALAAVPAAVDPAAEPASGGRRIKWLASVALVLLLLGIAAGGAALVMRGRRAGAATDPHANAPALTPPTEPPNEPSPSASPSASAAVPTEPLVIELSPSATAEPSPSATGVAATKEPLAVEAPPKASAAPSSSTPKAVESAPMAATASPAPNESAGKRPVTPLPNPRRTTDCSTPYYWDADGTKHIKPECL